MWVQGVSPLPAQTAPAHGVASSKTFFHVISNYPALLLDLSALYLSVTLRARVNN